MRISIGSADPAPALTSENFSAASETAGIFYHPDIGGVTSLMLT
jgi:hypothetical protein